MYSTNYKNYDFKRKRNTTPTTRHPAGHRRPSPCPHAHMLTHHTHRNIGQTAFGQNWCFKVLTAFGQTAFGQNWCFKVLTAFDQTAFWPELVLFSVFWPCVCVFQDLGVFHTQTHQTHTNSYVRAIGLSF